MAALLHFQGPNSSVGNNGQNRISIRFQSYRPHKVAGLTSALNDMIQKTYKPNVPEVEHLKRLTGR